MYKIFIHWIGDNKLHCIIFKYIIRDNDFFGFTRIYEL